MGRPTPAAVRSWTPGKANGHWYASQASLICSDTALWFDQQTIKFTGSAAVMLPESSISIPGIAMARPEMQQLSVLHVLDARPAHRPARCVPNACQQKVLCCRNHQCGVQYTQTLTAVCLRSCAAGGQHANTAGKPCMCSPRWPAVCLWGLGCPASPGEPQLHAICSSQWLSNRLLHETCMFTPGERSQAVLWLLDYSRSARLLPGRVEHIVVCGHSTMTCCGGLQHVRYRALGLTNLHSVVSPIARRQVWLACLPGMTYTVCKYKHGLAWTLPTLCRKNAKYMRQGLTDGGLQRQCMKPERTLLELRAKALSMPWGV